MNLYKVKVIDDNVVDYDFLIKSDSLFDIYNETDVHITSTDIGLLRLCGITYYTRIKDISKYIAVYIINLDHEVDESKVTGDIYNLSILFDRINKTIKRDIKINSIYEPI